MKYDSDRNAYTLATTGRVIEANCGLLNPAPGGKLAEGYDDVIEFYESPLTPAERAEIAEYAIAEWRAWAATGDPDPGEPGKREDPG